jgi:hypothetical protein
MNNRLEQFIRDHREEFDAEEPGKKIWEKIQFQMDPVKKESAIPVIWISTRKWTAVAAVSLLMAGSVWYFSRTATPSQKGDSSIATNAPAAQAPSDTTSKTTSKVRSRQIHQPLPEYWKKPRW